MKKIVKKCLMVLVAVVCFGFSAAAQVCKIEGGNIEVSSHNLNGNEVTVYVLNDSPYMANVKATVTVTYKAPNGSTKTRSFSSGLTLVTSGGPNPIVVRVDETIEPHYHAISAEVTSISGTKCQ